MFTLLAEVLFSCKCDSNRAPSIARKGFLLLIPLLLSSNAFAVDTDMDGLDDDVELTLVQTYPFLDADNLDAVVDGAFHVIKADLDNDGDLDVVAAAANADTVAWYENDGAGNFDPAKLIATGADGAQSIAVADFDGVNGLDVVVASFDGHDVVWYKNDGLANPTFSLGGVVQVGTQLAPASVAVGDFDGINGVDVVVASLGDQKVAWYPNNGSGGFPTQNLISTGILDGPIAVIAVDLDGDSDVDVAAAALNDDKVVWFENNGSGSFASEDVITTTANGVFYLTAADIGGDALPDLIVVSTQDDKLAWYQNNQGVGGGSWGSEVVISTAGDLPASVDAADFDSDGDLDLVVASNADNTVAWFENDGAANFTRAVITTTAVGAQSVATGDFDGNNAPDIVSASNIGDSIDWYRNPATDPMNDDTDGDTLKDGAEVNTHFSNPVLADTDGDGLDDGVEVNQTFTSPVLTDHDDDNYTDFEEVNHNLNLMPPSYEVGFDTNPLNNDTDGDGLDDGDEVKIYLTDPLVADSDGDGLNDGFEVTYGFVPTNGALGEEAADTDGDGLDNLAEQTNNANPLLADTDGDGLDDGPEVNAHLTEPDLVDSDSDGLGDGFEVTYGFDPTNGALNEEIGDGDGDLLLNLGEYLAGSDPTDSDTDDDGLSDGHEVDTLGTDPTLVDTDGDGLVDGSDGVVPTSSYPAGVDENNNTFVDGESDQSTDPLNADTDGDGLFDGFEVDYGFNPNATGEESGDGDSDGLSNLEEQMAGTDPGLADSDSDGLDDGVELSLVGSFPFQSQQVITTLADGAYAVATADLDGDGDVDAVSASNTDNEIAWYANDGTGVFGAQQIITSTALGAQDVVLVDLDTDGDIDIVSASFDDDTIGWYENNGSGVFDPVQVISTLADGAEAVAVGDINGDGFIDVVSVSSDDDKVAWYASSGGANPTFGAQQVIDQITLDATAGAVNVVVADLGGNSDIDVVVASYLDNTVAWYENKINAGGGDWGSRVTITTNALSVFGVALSDIDGDGNLDVLSASNDDNKVAWYENKQDVGGGSWGTEQIITTLAISANAVAAADLDRDGDNDVVSASSTDGTIAWYENSGGATPTFGSLQVISTQALAANDVATADIDADAVIDVLSASRSDDKIAWYRNPATDPANADTDGDGLTDGNEVNVASTDPLNNDSDGDTVLDGADSDPLDEFVCSDTDADTCEDCLSGTYDPANDGPDANSNGICDAGEGLDTDGDGVPDVDDSAPTNQFICRDVDADTCDDCSSGTDDVSNDGTDTDSDGVCNAGDADDDNDTVADGSDTDPLNQFVCQDADADTCDDCSVAGTPATSNDGTDTDSDGACDAGDADDDNDGVVDGSDSAPTNPNICSDTDADSCDDCTSGTFNVSNDGTDTDSDGLCDAGDTDDDNDTVADGSDTDPLDQFVCQDSDADTCDDCSVAGSPATSNDGTDTDSDGLCDAGDTDDDGDGVADGSDTDSLDAFVCSDTDADTCDDCSVTGTQTPLNDGPDADMDGICDAGETGPTDTDGDGISDSDETASGTNPLVFNALGDLAPRNAGDGVLNGADILIMSRLLSGAITPTASELHLADLNAISGIDVGDQLVLERAVTGLIPAP